MSEEQANIVGSNLRVIYPESEYYEDPQSKAIDATKTKISQTVTLLWSCLPSCIQLDSCFASCSLLLSMCHSWTTGYLQILTYQVHQATFSKQYILQLRAWRSKGDHYNIPLVNRWRRVYGNSFLANDGDEELVSTVHHSCKVLRHKRLHQWK